MAIKGFDGHFTLKFKLQRFVFDPMGDMVDIHWIPWDPMISSGTAISLFTMGFSRDTFVRESLKPMSDYVFGLFGLLS